MNPNDPAIWQALLIGIVTVGVLLLIYNNRQRIAAVNTPFIDTIIRNAVYWLVGLVILTTVATAVLSIVGVTNPIRVLSAESLMQICIGFAAVTWARKQ